MPKSAFDKRNFIIVGVLVLIFAIIGGFLLNGVLPLPPQGAAQAATVDNLFQVHMWLIAILFALVVVFMLYSLVVFRRKGRSEDGEHFEGNTTLEILWTVVPLILVVVFAYIGVVTLADVTANSPDEIKVAVTGQQWSWQFGYPNGTTNADLVVPVNKPLLLEMTSPDVIHSFWIPEWRIKQDVVPGLTTHVNFTPTELGEFQLMCNQVCGLSHTIMYAKVRVVSEAEYTAWLGDQLALQGQQTASN